MYRSLLLLIGSLFVQGIVVAANPEDLPASKELVDPFTFNDGTRVKSTSDWEKRRQEIKKLFAEYEYGHLPPTPKQWTLEDDEEEMSVDPESGAITQILQATFKHEDRELVMHIRLVLPKEPRNVPIVIQPSFGPLRRKSTPADKQPRWPDPAKEFAERGYAYAEFQVTDIAADDREKPRDGGIYEFFGEDIDCGALMAWAWGFHRVVDVLEDIGQVDTDKIVVTGHSRYGKAALIAGAFDERIALTAPSHSGCAGTAPFRFIYGKSEQLENIAGAFPYWFSPGFDEFAKEVDKLPVDQHLLRALVAPRAQLSTEGTQDAWTNPEGSQLTYLAAKEVYKFLGVPDKISIHFREVGHIPNHGDVLDFADHVFFNKPLTDEFGKLAYPVEEKAYSWTMPAE
jgi:endo-1,4-beta-xylanase